MNGTVYVLHFDTPISPKSTTQHYVGWAYHLGSRIEQHLKGRGSRLTRVAKERNIGFVIAATFPGDRRYERRIKNRHNTRKLCPICRRALGAQLTLDLPEEDLL